MAMSKREQQHEQETRPTIFIMTRQRTMNSEFFLRRNALVQFRMEQFLCPMRHHEMHLLLSLSGPVFIIIIIDGSFCCHRHVVGRQSKRM